MGGDNRRRGEVFSETTIKDTWTKAREGESKGRSWVWLGWGESGRRVHTGNCN